MVNSTNQVFLQKFQFEETHICRYQCSDVSRYHKLQKCLAFNPKEWYTTISTRPKISDTMNVRLRKDLVLPSMLEMPGQKRFYECAQCKCHGVAGQGTGGAHAVTDVSDTEDLPLLEVKSICKRQVENDWLPLGANFRSATQMLQPDNPACRVISEVRRHKKATDVEPTFWSVCIPTVTQDTNDQRGQGWWGQKTFISYKRTDMQENKYKLLCQFCKARAQRNTTGACITTVNSR